MEHYKTLQALFPDSGVRLAAFNEELFERIVPALERIADTGRPYALRKIGSEAEVVSLAELMPPLAADSAVAREWVEREFTIHQPIRLRIAADDGGGQRARGRGRGGFYTALWQCLIGFDLASMARGEDWILTKAVCET